MKGPTDLKAVSDPRVQGLGSQTTACCLRAWLHLSGEAGQPRLLPNVLSLSPIAPPPRGPRWEGSPGPPSPGSWRGKAGEQPFAFESRPGVLSGPFKGRPGAGAVPRRAPPSPPAPPPAFPRGPAAGWFSRPAAPPPSGNRRTAPAALGCPGAPGWEVRLVGVPGGGAA